MKIEIRRIKEEDIESFVDLIVRLKTLNNEFDSTFKVCRDIQNVTREYLKNVVVEKANHIPLGAFDNGKVVGILNTAILKRICYEPSEEARIIEFYVMPEYRNKGVGKTLISELYKILKERNITFVTSEFPALNLIALNFYKKIGYREIVKVYGKTV